MKYFLFIFTLLSANFAYTQNTCSRSAKVNHQKILVDPSSTQKGEGLRFYLQNDRVAKSYLDTYQEGSQIKWQNAVAGSLGSGLILTSLFIDESDKRKTYLISGLSILLVNFLMAQTFSETNEKNLNRAIEEYNKRNFPKIYFNPLSYSSKFDYEVHVAKTWRF